MEDERSHESDRAVERKLKALALRVSNLEDHLFPPEGADTAEIEARTIALIEQRESVMQGGSDV